MPRRRTYTVHQVLCMLEDDTSVTDADIYITPPLDPNCSDEDSGGEDEGTMSNLTCQQLQAEAEVTVRHGAEKIRISNEIDSADQISDQPAVLPTSAAPDQSTNESAVPSIKPVASYGHHLVFVSHRKVVD